MTNQKSQTKKPGTPATTDMTQGNPLRLIVLFAVPLLLSSVCQQLYNVADSIIVGRLLGVDAFAAVGAAFPYYWFAFGVVLGLAQGFGVLFAQRFGAGDGEGLRSAAGQTILLTAVLSLVVTVAGLALIRPALGWLNTPAEITNDAADYLVWLIVGMPVFFAGNSAMAMLRSLGNSRAPLYSVLLSSIVNILLDIVFVAFCGMGVAGAAIATVIGAFFSLLYCLWQLRATPVVRIAKSHLTPAPAVLYELLRLGMPIAFQSAVISIGMMVIQGAINGYGTNFIAGVSAAGRYFGILNLVGFALDGAVVVYVGQNYGAGKLARIRTGVSTSVKIAVVSSVCIGAVMAVLGKQMIALFITASPQTMSEITQIGYNNLLAFAICLPALYLLFVFRSSIQGMGNSFIPMLSGFTELAARLFSVMLLTRHIGIWGIYFADGMGWVTAALLLGVGYYFVFNNRQRTSAKNEM